MVQLSNNSIEKLKTFRAIDDFVDALIQLCCVNGKLDTDTYRKMWTALQNKYSNIKQTVEQHNQLAQEKSNPKLSYSNDFLEKILAIDNTIQRVGIESQRLSDNVQHLSELEETRFISDLTDITLKTNEIYRNYASYMTRLGYKRNMMERIRNSWLGKAFIRSAMVLALFGATGQKEEAAGIREPNVKESMETKSPVANYVNTLNLGDIELTKQILDSTNMDVLSKHLTDPTTKRFNSPILMDSVKTTAYLPKGKGLMAGTYKATGITSTTNDALHNFDGIAVVNSIIPYGSIVYIKGLGWKVADDTGSMLQYDADTLHIVHIDIRMNNLKQAKAFGVQNTVIVVLTPSIEKPADMRLDTWRFKLVKEARAIVKELNKKRV